MGGPLRPPQMKASPSRPKVTDSQESFVGGQNPKAGTNIVSPDQCAAMTNVRLVRDGEIGKRPGLRKLTPGATVLPTTARFYQSPFGSLNVLALDDAAAAKRFTYAGGTSYTVTALASLGASYASGVGSAAFRDASADVVYIAARDTSAAKGMIKWDGAGTITEDIASGSVTGLSQLWVYNQRLFGVKGTPGGLGMGGLGQTVYYSGLNNGDTMAVVASGGGSATIRTYGGQALVGGFALGNSNFLLHQNAISVFRGTTFDDINITAGTSGVAPNIGYPMAWRVIDQVGYVLTAEGLFLASEGGFRPAATADRPDPIATFLRSTTDDFSPGGAGASWFVLDNARRNEVWCIIQTRSGAGTVTPRIYIWNTLYGRFTGQCTLSFRLAHADVILDSNGQPLMAFTKYLTADLFATDFLLASNQVYQDDGSSYTSSVQLRRMFTQAPSALKAWRKATVQMGSGAGETAATNGSATGATLSYTTSGATVADTTDLKAQQANEIQLSGQGDSIDLTITDGGLSSTGWSVLRAEVEGASYGARGG
jgi:hypothetical protein